MPSNTPPSPAHILTRARLRSQVVVQSLTLRSRAAARPQLCMGCTVVYGRVSVAACRRCSREPASQCSRGPRVVGATVGCASIPPAGRRRRHRPADAPTAPTPPLGDATECCQSPPAPALPPQLSGALLRPFVPPVRAATTSPKSSGFCMPCSLQTNVNQPNWAADSCSPCSIYPRGTYARDFLYGR